MDTNPENPAIEFLSSAVGDSCSAEKLVVQYANFLLRAVGCQSLPVDLDSLVNHYNIAVCRFPLAGQRAMSTSDLRIFLEQDDPETVQRYSIAHELTEFLFGALSGSYPKLSKELLKDLWDRKEALCELGAASILMPMNLFEIPVRRLGFTMSTGRYLASLCRVSLTATLRRMLDTRVKRAMVLYFKLSHSSTQYIPSAVGQTNIFGPPELMDPPRKLRVLRRFTSSYGKGDYIPRQKSVDNGTSIYQCYQNGSYTSGFDDLDLVGVKGNFFVESMPISLDEERIVISLLHLE